VTAGAPERSATRVALTDPRYLSLAFGGSSGRAVRWIVAVAVLALSGCSSASVLTPAPTDVPSPVTVASQAPVPTVTGSPPTPTQAPGSIAFFYYLDVLGAQRTTTASYSCANGSELPTYHAVFTQPAGGPNIYLALVEVDPSGGRTALEKPRQQTLTNPADLFYDHGLAEKIRDLCARLKPGMYGLRVLAADQKTLLAFGTFTLTP